MASRKGVFPQSTDEERAALIEKPARVSVVLPTYNGSRFIRQSIDSLLNQTMPDWELIVVDDCSSDGTSSIVLDYKDSRIQYVRNGANCRLPRALNRGFQLASGEYLTWTSDDNYYEPNALERLTAALDANPDVDLVASHFHRVDEEGNAINERIVEPVFLAAEVNPVGACFLYRRSVLHKIGLYNPEFFKAEDAEYWMRINWRGMKIRIVDEFLYHYRIHAASLTATNQPQDVPEFYARLRRDYVSRWHRLKLRAYRKAKKYGSGEWAPFPLRLLLPRGIVSKAVHSYERKFYIQRFERER